MASFQPERRSPADHQRKEEISRAIAKILQTNIEGEEEALQKLWFKLLEDDVLTETDVNIFQELCDQHCEENKEKKVTFSKEDLPKDNQLSMDIVVRLEAKVEMIGKSIRLKEMWANLIKQGVFTSEQCQSIQAIETETKQAAELLHLIIGGSSDAFEGFLRSLALTGQSYIIRWLGLDRTEYVHHKDDTNVNRKAKDFVVCCVRIQSRVPEYADTQEMVDVHIEKELKAMMETTLQNEDGQTMKDTYTELLLALGKRNAVPMSKQLQTRSLNIGVFGGRQSLEDLNEMMESGEFSELVRKLLPEDVLKRGRAANMTIEASIRPEEYQRCWYALRATRPKTSSTIFGNYGARILGKIDSALSKPEVQTEDQTEAQTGAKPKSNISMILEAVELLHDQRKIDFPIGQMPEEATIPNRNKCITIIGHPGAGKTSLCRRLHGETFKKKHVPTAGIDIHLSNAPKENSPWEKLSAESREELVSRWFSKRKNRGSEVPPILRIWDFGGSTENYALHKSYLNLSSIILVVLDLSLDLDTKIDKNLEWTMVDFLEYWFNSIYNLARATGTTPKVVVVGTHKGQRIAREKQKGLDGILSKIKGYLQNRPFWKLWKDDDKPQIFAIENSLSQDSGAQKILKTIYQLVKEDPGVPSMIPMKIFQLRDKIDEVMEEEGILTKSEVKEICLNFGLLNKISTSKDSTERLDDILMLLHTAGDIVYFKDLPGLSADLLISPRWLHDAMKQIMTDPSEHSGDEEIHSALQDFHKSGFIPGKMLETLWGKRTQYILPLLIHFRSFIPHNLLHENKKVANEYQKGFLCPILMTGNAAIRQSTFNTEPLVVRPPMGFLPFGAMVEIITKLLEEDMWQVSSSIDMQQAILFPAGVTSFRFMLREGKSKKGSYLQLYLPEGHKPAISMQRHMECLVQRMREVLNHFCENEMVSFGLLCEECKDFIDVGQGTRTLSYNFGKEGTGNIKCTECGHHNKGKLAAIKSWFNTSCEMSGTQMHGREAQQLLPMTSQQLIVEIYGDGSCELNEDVWNELKNLDAKAEVAAECPSDKLRSKASHGIEGDETHEGSNTKSVGAQIMIAIEDHPKKGGQKRVMFRIEVMEDETQNKAGQTAFNKTKSTFEAFHSTVHRETVGDFDLNCSVLAELITSYVTSVKSGKHMHLKDSLKTLTSKENGLIADRCIKELESKLEEMEYHEVSLEMMKKEWCINEQESKSEEVENPESPFELMTNEYLAMFSDKCLGDEQMKKAGEDKLYASFEKLQDESSSNCSEALENMKARMMAKIYAGEYMQRGGHRKLQENVDKQMQFFHKATYLGYFRKSLWKKYHQPCVNEWLVVIEAECKLLYLSWKITREQTLKAFQKAIDDTNLEERIQSGGQIGYSTVGVGAAVMTIVGLALSVPTLGVSLGLTIGGIATGVASAGASIGHRVAKNEIIRRIGASAKRHLKWDRKISEKFYIVVSEMMEYGKEHSVESIVGGINVGARNIAQTASLISGLIRILTTIDDVAGTAGKVAGRVGIPFAGIAAAADIAQIGYHIHYLATDRVSDPAKELIELKEKLDEGYKKTVEEMEKSFDPVPQCKESNVPEG